MMRQRLHDRVDTRRQDRIGGRAAECEQFAELVCADPELLAAEFAAIIAENFPDPTGAGRRAPIPPRPALPRASDAAAPVRFPPAPRPGRARVGEDRGCGVTGRCGGQARGPPPLSNPASVASQNQRTRPVAGDRPRPAPPAGRGEEVVDAALLGPTGAAPVPSGRGGSAFCPRPDRWYRAGVTAPADRPRGPPAAPVLRCRTARCARTAHPRHPDRACGHAATRPRSGMLLAPREHRGIPAGPNTHAESAKAIRTRPVAERCGTPCSTIGSAAPCFLPSPGCGGAFCAPHGTGRRPTRRLAHFSVQATLKCWQQINGLEQGKVAPIRGRRSYRRLESVMVE